LLLGFLALAMLCSLATPGSRPRDWHVKHAGGL
jgi:hypothetical protein